jgi:putative chitinase
MTDTITLRSQDWTALEQAFAQAAANMVRGQDEIVVTAPRPAPAPAAPPVTETEDASFAFRDYGAFYDWLRGNDMLGPKITAGEFEGCDRIIKACAKQGWGISWVAYALATTYHEVNGTMQPIKEIGGPAYFTRMYDIRGARPAKARELGNLTPGDGAKFAGRGYVQLTGLTNYRRATKKLREMGFDVDLVAQPERAMEPAIAAAILVAGMREGWFTGRDIDDDLPASGPARLAQFVASRDIINGRDRQDLIAEYAMDFQTALLESGYRPPA